MAVLSSTYGFMHKYNKASQVYMTGLNLTFFFVIYSKIKCTNAKREVNKITANTE